MANLTDKSALITGGSRGIGAALVFVTGILALYSSGMRQLTRFSFSLIPGGRPTFPSLITGISGSGMPLRRTKDKE
jgi:hypothetical protein